MKTVARLGTAPTLGEVAMASCKFIETCIFFNDKMAEMPSIANLYKRRFCEAGDPSCARHRVVEALGRENVPQNLYPNDAERADALIG
jgi:hypothetical protein